MNSVNDKKFTSHQRDQESGLDYAMNRFDSNTSGRFMSVDKGPMVLRRPGSLNRYSYAELDPVNHTDPDGNFIGWGDDGVDMAFGFYLWGLGLPLPRNTDGTKVIRHPRCRSRRGERTLHT